MQTGHRIGYFPNTALDEISGFQRKLATLPHLIEAMHATESSPAFAATMSESNSDHPHSKLVQYNSVIDSALAHIADISETQSQASIKMRTAEEP
jgi:hypothetical protein